ncbi:MAG: hypothetical protein ACI8Z1_003452 [Candidatus Azotimanducaceae bacterium]|jgi:uncharacterized protein (DUF1330 family)
MPAYMISHVTVTNQEKFQSYLAETRAVAAKYGARPVAMGNQPKMLNGDGDGHQIVVVAEFESMERLDAWHASEEYKAIEPLRDAGSIQHMVAYEGMPMSPS